MSITVNFYKNVSDNRFLRKNISLLQTITCDVYYPCDRLNPVLVIDKDNIDFEDTNYCYIEEFGRYYFITNISGEAANIVQVSCHVDVLMTYNSKIRNCPIIAARSSNNTNSYLIDENRIFKTTVFNQYLTITPAAGAYPLPSGVGSDGRIGAPDALVLITI